MANSFHSRAISTLHLAWAAGFIEGEGSFSSAGRQSACVTAAQVQKEPIDRLQALFGGRVVQRHTKGHSSRPIWVWSLTARRSIEVMMTLYVLMSPRRQGQIEVALAMWKAQKRILRPHGSKVCGSGHLLEGGNVYTSKGRVHCRACRLSAKRVSNTRLRPLRPVKEFDLRRLRGHLNPNAKLSLEHEAEVLRALLNGEIQKSIAKRYGVSQALISSIKIRAERNDKTKRDLLPSH